MAVWFEHDDALPPLTKDYGPQIMTLVVMAVVTAIVLAFTL